MKAIVNNSDGPVVTTVKDPRPGSGEALVAVRAFSVNRGELALLQTRTGGWRPGQDVAGVIVEPAADGLYHLVTDWVGGASLAAGLAKVTPGGTVVLGSGSTEKTPLSIYDFFGHEGARVVGYLSYAYPEPPGPDLATLAGLAAAGRLDPGVSLTLPWTRLPDALAALAERRISGKAVLTVG